jgi:hypothetical protein
VKIEIGEKIKPFSHVSGTRALVPCSSFVVQLFPALLRVEGDRDYPIQITGPVKEFTVQLDLEKQCVWVWGIAKEGYFKFRLEAMEEGLTLYLDRAPTAGLQIGDKRFQAKQKALLTAAPSYLKVDRVERISLGNMKAQEWDQVWRRMDLKEIVPALFLLGQMTPHKSEAIGGTESLLKAHFDLFVQTAFSDLLIPRLQDTQFQGIAPSHQGSGDPHSLLTKAYRHLRTLLLEEANPTLKILPHLPVEWDCGRATALHVEGLGDLDLEWSKKTIRRMVIRAAKTSHAKLLFAKPVAIFRLDGKLIDNGSTLAFEAGSTYHFDRFQK